jgi:hypothetical protein
MKINFAHMREKSVSGGWIDFAVFDTRSVSGAKSDNAKLLLSLTNKARSAGLKVDQSALAYTFNGRTAYFGSKHLVDYLSKSWFPQWTHTLDV